MLGTNHRARFNKWNTLAVRSKVDVRLAKCTFAEGTIERNDNFLFFS